MATDFQTKLSYGIIRVIGENAEKFLQGQLTCDLREITPTQASLAALCNPQGRIIASIYLCKYLDDYLFILPITMVEKVINHLTKYAVFSKVTLHDVTQEFILLGWLENPSLLQKECDELPSNLYQVAASTTQIIICVGQARFLQLKQVSSCDQEFIQRINYENENLWRHQDIIDGMAMIYPQTSLLFTPHMVNYSKLGAVSYKKGCYVGQEIIARTHYIGKSKRHLYRGFLENSLRPQLGDLIYQDKTEGGVIVEISCLQKNQYHFLAVIQDHVDLTKLSLANSDSKITDLIKM